MYYACLIIAFETNYQYFLRQGKSTSSGLKRLQRQYKNTYILREETIPRVKSIGKHDDRQNQT